MREKEREIPTQGKREEVLFFFLLNFELVNNLYFTLKHHNNNNNNNISFSLTHTFICIYKGKPSSKMHDPCV